MSLAIFVGCLPTFPQFFRVMGTKIMNRSFLKSSRLKESTDPPRETKRAKNLAWLIPTVWGGATRGGSIGLTFLNTRNLDRGESRVKIQSEDIPSDVEQPGDSAEGYIPEHRSQDETHQVREEVSFTVSRERVEDAKRPSQLV